MAPAIAVTAELPMKASSFHRTTSIDVTAAASSSSLMAFHARPGSGGVQAGNLHRVVESNIAIIVNSSGLSKTSTTRCVLTWNC